MLFDSQETRQNIKRLEDKSMPGLLQKNREEQERFENKKVDRRRKAGKSAGVTSSASAQVSQVMNLDQLIIKEKESQAELNKGVKLWIRTDFLNQRAKNECEFL